MKKATRLRFGPPNYRKSADVKPWVKRAITSEERKDQAAMWRGAPSAEGALQDRLKRIKFLKKFADSYPTAKFVSERLASCRPKRRCLSGACPECGRLLQRWFVRRSRTFIRDEIKAPGKDLVALNIVPSRPVVQPGGLKSFSLVDLQRRLKFALDKVQVGIAIGGIDFSFNEDRKGKYPPFWCPHAYLIFATDQRRKIGKTLRKLPQFEKTAPVPKPIRIPEFNNNYRRRSYALKMTFKRRIGYDEIKNRKNGKSRKCRNTSTDKLRAVERIELFLYLDQIGLAQRAIFRGGKPRISAGKVKIETV